MKLLFAKTAEGVKFYPITIAEGVIYKPANGSAMKLNEFLDSIDYSGKADKVANATSGNFAGLDANGNLTDSGVKAADFKTKQTAKADPTASGNGVEFIDSITQDANGEITATKKTVQNASGSQAGLMSANDFTKLGDLPTKAELDTELGAKADKVASPTAGNFAGLDANGNLTDSGSKASDFDAAGAADTAEQNAKDYADGLIDNLGGSASQAAADANGNIAASVTSEKGEVKTISVDASALKAAAASDATTKANAAQAAAEATAAADATSKVSAAKEELIGESTDASSANTINGAKNYAKEYADSRVQGGVFYQSVINSAADLPDGSTSAKEYKKGWYYKVGTAGTYAGHVCQVGDALIANKDYAAGAVAADDWDKLEGNVAVSDSGASLTIGSPVKVAEVEGVEIHVTQVEDMTKIEAEACGDTTEYPDYSSLFTTPEP